MKRIICIGNRYAVGDDGGPAVFDWLRVRPAPPGVEVLDGGLKGLDLLPVVDGCERVVFVDSVSGFGSAPVVLDGPEVAAYASARCDHSSGLPYLLRVLPLVCEKRTPEVFLVGVAEGADGAAVERAAALALRVAAEGAPVEKWGQTVFSGDGKYRLSPFFGGSP